MQGLHQRLYAADGDQLAVAGVGCLVAEHIRRDPAAAEDLVHEGELHLAVSLPTELGVDRIALRRKNLLPESARAVIDYAFERFGYDALHSSARVTNPAISGENFDSPLK